MYVLGDFLSCIKNGFMVSKLEVVVRKSKFLINILNILLQEGYIRGFTVMETKIIVFLKYNKGFSVIKNLKIISKPTKRIYYTFKVLKKLSKENRYVIISTSKGIISNKDYSISKTGLGGEVLFYIK